MPEEGRFPGGSVLGAPSPGAGREETSSSKAGEAARLRVSGLGPWDTFLCHSGPQAPSVEWVTRGLAASRPRLAQP